ncbi:MAG: aminopeptidase N [Rhodospirillales bacterium]|nr:aminopeptidase N [Rhodospirillales bacterium]
MRTEEPRAIYLSDYQPPDYRVETIALHVTLVPDATKVRAELCVVASHEGETRPFRLDGDDLPLDAVAIDGEALGTDAYRHDASGLVIHEPPRAFTLVTETTIAPAANTALEGLYVSSDMFCTQCEAEGFRRITFYPDRPDVLATYTVTMDADKVRYPILLSNGNLVEACDLGDGRHRAVWHDPFPKPSYLFALVAGDLGSIKDTFTTASGRVVDLRIWSEHGNQEKCTYAMDALKRSMRWDEERYGLEYDLDIFNIVAVGDFNMGAMENKSLNIFNSKLVLASPETATDGDYDAIESVIAHEYFHNWTGDRVTCRDWFQLSLKEGLTVYRDQEFSADMRSRAVKRIDDVRRLRSAQFPEDAGPLAHPVRPENYIEINNFYTATVYEKGAEVIRMMERLLGRNGFRKGMDLYFERHDGQAVTCDDFVAAMADANDADLNHFKLWYSQAGTPVISASGAYDADTRSYELTLAQATAPTPGQPDKKPLHIPFEVGLIGPNGSEMETTVEGVTSSSHVLNLTSDSMTFRFGNVGAAPVPSLNRGFSAPVRLKTDLSDEDCAFLLAHDTDPFARWEAGQQYGTRVLLDMVAQIRSGVEATIDDHYVEALGAVLADGGIDPMAKAQALSMPAESYLADQMETVDVDAIHTAREAMRLALGQRYRDDWLATFNACRCDEPFSPDAAQAGRRALKGAALTYYAATADAEAIARVKAEYDRADNMTERLAALVLIGLIDAPERAACFDDFYVRFRNDDLVVNKWLGVQALSPLPGAVDRVAALLGHEAFNIRNPNKVYALVGAFAMGNPVNFHKKDGSGYRFLADRLLELDALNPHVAARMVDALGRWQRQDSARQELMKAELRRVRARDGLSPDLIEKIDKSLA